jgi:cytochrome c biogenesis protein CcmG, thiol:disulfide interchange protein DsbE
MIKRSLLPIIWCFFAMSFFAQTQNISGHSYPFNVGLTNLDSLPAATDTLFKKGKPTVLAFWLTTCAPCKLEFSAYAQRYESWKKQADFDLVAISIDWPERFGKMVEMARQQNWPFPVYWDGGRAFKDILPGELNGLPQVFIFDKNGRLAWHHEKYRPGDEEELFAKVLELK